MNNPIEITNLSLSSRGQTILEDINLSLPPGSFLGLIGPNGAGKTVLLKVILGLIQPTSGEVRIFGKPPAEAHREISYVPQYAHFDATFPISVIDVVLMGRLGRTRYFRRYSDADREKAYASLEKMDLTPLAEKQVGRLSGGQLQRVLIARALTAEPKILLLDEPTASLDSRVGTSVYQALADQAGDMTIVLVSHDIGVISTHVKTIACLNRRMHYHESKEISGEVLAEVYGCPVELIAHGHAHRVLEEHEHHHHHPVPSDTQGKR
ncbi:MAG: ABC transporter ATP-binding protein [Bdellovibrionota bacterium]